MSNTPTSPRRMSTAAPFRHRSVSPQQQQASQGTAGSGNSSGAPLSSSQTSSPAKQNPPRSKSPTLIISRHTPSASGGGAPSKAKGGASVPNSFKSNVSTSSSFSVSRVSNNQGAKGESIVSKAWSQPPARPSSSNTNNSNSNNNSSNSKNIDSASALSSQPIRCKSPSPGRLRSPSPLSVAQTPQQSSATVHRTAPGSSVVKGKGQGQRVTTPRRLPGSTMIR